MFNNQRVIYIYNLVGGLEHVLFSPIVGIIIPTDEPIFFKGVGQPPTSNPFIGLTLNHPFDVDEAREMSKNLVSLGACHKITGFCKDDDKP